MKKILDEFRRFSILSDYQIEYDDNKLFIKMIKRCYDYDGDIIVVRIIENSFTKEQLKRMCYDLWDGVIDRIYEKIEKDKKE